MELPLAGTPLSDIPLKVCLLLASHFLLCKLLVFRAGRLPYPGGNVQLLARKASRDGNMLSMMGTMSVALHRLQEWISPAGYAVAASRTKHRSAYPGAICWDLVIGLQTPRRLTLMRELCHRQNTSIKHLRCRMVFQKRFMLGHARHCACMSLYIHTGLKAMPQK